MRPGSSLRMNGCVRSTACPCYLSPLQGEGRMESRTIACFLRITGPTGPEFALTMICTSLGLAHPAGDNDVCVLHLPAGLPDPAEVHTGVFLCQVPF